MTALKTVALGFLGAVLAIGAWIALDASGLVRGPSMRVAEDAGEFERRVRDYVVENPQVLVDSFRRLREQQSAAESSNSDISQVVAARASEIFEDPATPIGGNPQGDVSLVEFFDYNCPYCRRVTPILAELEGGDPGLRIVYKEWPILGPNSELAARAALASRDQGKYVEFHKAMMLADGVMNESKVFEIAAAVGLDVERLKTDMNASEIAALIERNRALAEALRVTGTPSFVIGSELLRGAADAEVIKGYIRRAREARAARP